MRIAVLRRGFGILRRENFALRRNLREARTENDLEIIDDINFADLPFRLFIATYFGANKTRLIDNLKVI